MILKGAKVLVIGASGGLGKAVVLELCKQHVGSLFLCGRNEKELLSLQEQGQKCGISTATAAFDLRDENLLTAFFADLDNNGGIDAALILSGISLTKDANGFEDLYEINRGFDVNAKACIKCIYLAANLMQKAQHGQIVVISSLASLLALPSSPVYSASKAALNVYVKAIRPYLQSLNITLSLVLPGFFKSPMEKRFIGRKLFCVSTQKAAKKVINVMRKQKAFCAFPWYFYCVIVLLSFLPNVLQRPLMGICAFSVEPDNERRSYLEKKVRSSHV